MASSAGLDRSVLGVSALFAAVELAVAARYGFHRDELYFMACARHLSWGYVDQPPGVAALAAELGAGPRGRLLTACVTAASPLMLGANHLLTTTSFDLLAWTALTWLVLRILRTGSGRLWLATGALAGLALLNKATIVFWAFGTGLALLLSPHRRVLRRPLLWAGVLLAAALWSPYLVWQARHGWPQLDMTRALRAGCTPSRCSG